MVLRSELNQTGHIISAPKSSNFVSFSGLIFMLQFLWDVAENKETEESTFASYDDVLGEG